MKPGYSGENARRNLDGMDDDGVFASIVFGHADNEIEEAYRAIDFAALVPWPVKMKVQTNLGKVGIDSYKVLRKGSIRFLSISLFRFLGDQMLKGTNIAPNTTIFGIELLIKILESHL